MIIGQPIHRQLGASKDVECLNKANASPQVAAIDQVINNLSKTWNPTGYFRTEDVQQILNVLANEAEAAGAALAAAPLSTFTAKELKAQAYEDVLRRYGDGSKPYIAAVAKARASGVAAINAPGLKTWVLASMRVISDAYVTATVLHCMQTWVRTLLDRAYDAMVTIGSVVSRIGGIALKVGQGIVDAVEATAGIAGAIIRYAPYVGAALVAYIGYVWIKRTVDQGPGSAARRVRQALLKR